MVSPQWLCESNYTELNDNMHTSYGVFPNSVQSKKLQNHPWCCHSSVYHVSNHVEHFILQVSVNWHQHLTWKSQINHKTHIRNSFCKSFYRLIKCNSIQFNVLFSSIQKLHLLWHAESMLFYLKINKCFIYMHAYILFKTFNVLPAISL